MWFFVKWVIVSSAIYVFLLRIVIEFLRVNRRGKQ